MKKRHGKGASSSITGGVATPSPSPGNGSGEERKGQKGAVAHPTGESSASKFLRRFFAGMALMGFFYGVVKAGHLYVILSFFVGQCILYSELLGLKHEDKWHVPNFRVVQWCWFFLAIFYS